MSDPSLSTQNGHEMSLNTPTTAQQISLLLHDDGQRWRDEEGRHLDEIAEEMKGRRTYRDGWGTDVYRWNFPDGSAIVVAGAGWDFPLSPDPACYCWEGEGRHGEGCPAYRDRCPG